MTTEANAEGTANRVAFLIISVVVLATLVYLANYFTRQAPNLFGRDFARALEFPLWAVLVGLLANGLLSAAGIKEKLTAAWRTELFLKVGLVLLGLKVNVATIMAVGMKGIVQALIMVSSVFFFTWWLGGKFKIKDELRAIMATAISICGVSAAIAAAGSVAAKKENLAYTITLVIITAIPLMVIMPYLAIWLGLPPQMAGAWFGGNIDTTAAVVGAGAIHSEEAMKVASIVKMAQNALIGVAAFGLALSWVVVVDRGKSGVGKPSAKIIWDRFPKFVIGFVVASIIASSGLIDSSTAKAVGPFRNWAFALAFVCIGLELSFKEIGKMGSRPIAVYMIATVFNTLLALLLAWLIFGGIIGL